MVHLLPLPGSPGYQGSMEQVVEIAVSDATALIDAGFPALMVENFGDTPFFADNVPPETTAAITRSVSALRDAVEVPVGVNVLRNDALSALAIATATGAAMIRVNVLTGTMYTDQGPIVGRAAEVDRKRQALDPGIEIWADVLVKHATPPAGLDPRQAALDTLERGNADALIVSGSGTGVSPDLERLKVIRDAIGDGTRLVVGSGAHTGNLADLLAIADTIIAGSTTKVDGRAMNRVDPSRAAAMVTAARQLDLI